MIVQVPEAKHLSSFLREMAQIYTLYFNSRYKNQGKLLSDRHKKIEIQGEGSLAEYIKFFEFIPVKHQRADNPVQYPWSSCSYRVLGDGDGILDRRPKPVTIFEDAEMM